MGFWSSTFGLFRGVLTSSKKPQSLEDRAERYQKWQQELAENQQELRKADNRMRELQRKLQSNPQDKMLNKRLEETIKKREKISHEMKKLNDNIGLHKP